MGEAFCAVSDDAGSVFYNPAGLGRVDRKIFSVTYIGQRRDDEISNIIKGDAITSISVVGMTGGISWRKLADYKTKNERCRIDEITFSAFEPKGTTLIGLNLRYLNGRFYKAKGSSSMPSLFSDTGNGVSFDLGILVNPLETLSLGAMWRNVWGKMYWGKIGDERLESRLRIGCAFSYKGFLLCGIDFERSLREETDSSLGFGIEILPGAPSKAKRINTLALRGGCILSEGDKEVSLGASYQFGGCLVSISAAKKNPARAKDLFGEEVYYVMTMDFL
jgi:hypothetical protein